MSFPPKHPARRAARRSLGAVLGTLLLVTFAAACSDDDDDDDDPDPGPVADHIFAARGDGMVRRYSGEFSQEDLFTTGSDHDLALDLLRNVIHASGAGAPNGEPGVRFMSNPFERGSGSQFNLTRDRELSGPATGLVDPRGIAVGHESGYLIVADLGAGDIKVFGTAAGGDVAPVAVAAAPADPWGVVYDEVDDRLFATLVDGTIAVYDDFSASGFGLVGPSRTITIVDSSGTQLPSTLRGIALDRSNDRLVVADPRALDVGQDPDWDSDGRLLMVANPSTVQGNVTALRRIQGASTELGNPTYLLLDGRRLIVADQATNELVVFLDVFTSSDQDQVPLEQVNLQNPRGLERLKDAGSLETLFGPDVSDVEGSGINFTGLAVVSNPSDTAAPGFGVVQRTPLGLGSVSASFDTGLSLKNITYDLAGDGYITFDDGMDLNGGIQVVNRLARGRDNGALEEGRDRLIQGASTLLVAPRGIEVTGNGLLLVAESNDLTPAILAFSACAEGDVAPVFVVTDLDGERPWALDYDPDADRLFVGTLSGQVLVYDDFLELSASGPPERILTITDASGTPIVTAVRGLIHVAGSDALILADPGVIATPGDGQVLIVDDAASVNGNVAFTARIFGTDTLLDDPMGLAFGNGNLFVGEKDANLVLRFDSVLALQGLYDQAPDAQISIQAPESMALLPEYLSSRPK